MADDVAEPQVASAPGAGPMPVYGLPEVAEPKTREEFFGLPAGTKFKDPEGRIREKPAYYEPKTQEDYIALPEGAEFIDPEGQIRRKPNYAGIGFSAQTLYDMALTPDAQKQVLEKFYPGKVREGPDGFYVEDEGDTSVIDLITGKDHKNVIYRKPGRGGAAERMGAAAAGVAPAAGMALGGILGGLGGTAVEPIGGTAAGAVGGAVLGAMAGRHFNNTMLALAGIHEGAGKQAEAVGWEGAAVAGGEVLGKAIAKIPGVANAVRKGTAEVARTARDVKARFPNILEALGITPERAREFLGTTPEIAERAQSITRKAQELGIQRGIVPPSVLAPESPYLHKIEDWDQIFRKQNVFAGAARDYYEKQGKDLLERPEIGLTLKDTLTRAAEKVSSQQAGQLALAAARREMAFADATLENAWRDARAAVARGGKGLEGFHWSPVSFDEFGPGKAWMRGEVGYMGEGVYLAKDPESAGVYKKFAEQTGVKSQGHLYRVSVIADPQRIVDLEKPFDEQSPFVQKALEPLLEGKQPFEAFGQRFEPRKTSVRDLASDYVDRHPELQRSTSGHISDIAPWMRQRGLAGIRHDASVDLEGKFAKQTVTGDLVVFDPKDVVIVERDGTQLRPEPGIPQVMERLAAAQKEAAETAKKFVDATLKDLDRETAAALKEVKADEAPGAVWRMTGAKFQGYKEAIKLRARSLYDAADIAGGDATLPNSGGTLGAQAQAFLDALPEAVRGKYPQEIRAIAKLAGRAATEDTEAIPPQDLTFKELRMLRSWLRHGIDYNDLTPDMREGALRYFEGKVNQFLHDTQLPGNFRAAAQMLDEADAFYRENIPFLHDKMVRTVMRGLESGMPPNPQEIARLLFDPKRTEAIRRAREIVGENLWKYVQAAHARDIIDNSRTLVPGEINGQRFAAQVEELVRNGVIESAYDKAFADRLLKTAQNVRKLEGAIPIGADDTDTLSTLMRKAEMAGQQAREMADRDPLKAFQGEMRRIDKEFDAAKKIARAERRASPLHFLYEDSFSAMATRAADRILGSQDLIMAAAQKWGRDSPEFKALQQVYVHRFFQRPLERVGKMRAELAGEKGMTEEVQALMFPGVTRNMMLELVKDAEFLFARAPSDVGSAMAGASRVLSPWSNLPIPRTSSRIMHLPGVSTLGRVVLGKLYATVVDGVSHPEFINWLTSNLKKGALEREIARRVLQQRLFLGGWIGATAGAGFGQELSGP